MTSQPKAHLSLDVIMEKFQPYKLCVQLCAERCKMLQVQLILPLLPKEGHQQPLCLIPATHLLQKLRVCQHNVPGSPDELHALQQGASAYRWLVQMAGQGKLHPVSVCSPVRCRWLTRLNRNLRAVVTLLNSCREIAPLSSSSNMENMISTSCKHFDI